MGGWGRDVMGEEIQQMWGVLKSKENEQLDADRRQPSVQHSNCKYCIKLWRHMTRVNNWIIKACLTKAWAPPPIWKGMSKVCDLHLCALIPLVGVGLPPESASPSAVISSFHLQEGQFFLVNCIWFCGSEKATVKWRRTSAPGLAWNASSSQVCEDLVVVYSLHSCI